MTPEASNTTAPIKYGTFNSRMMAATIDITLLLAVVMPVVDFLVPMPDFSLINQGIGPENASDPAKAFPILWHNILTNHIIEHTVFMYLLQISFVALYTIPFWFRYSTTPGKMLFRLQICDEKTGGRMTHKQAVTRFLGYFLSAIPFALGFVWMVFNKRRRGWHDILADTVVVVSPKKKKQEKDLSA